MLSRSISKIHLVIYHNSSHKSTQYSAIRPIVLLIAWLSFRVNSKRLFCPPLTDDILMMIKVGSSYFDTILSTACHKVVNI